VIEVDDHLSEDEIDEFLSQEYVDGQFMGNDVDIDVI
jgi:hypothetical protein